MVRMRRQPGARADPLRQIERPGVPAKLVQPNQAVQAVTVELVNGSLTPAILVVVEARLEEPAESARGVEHSHCSTRTRTPVSRTSEIFEISRRSAFGEPEGLPWADRLGDATTLTAAS